MPHDRPLHPVGSPTWMERLTDHLDLLGQTVMDHGFAIQTVFPTSPATPWFAYTIGLWPAHQAELIIRGFGDQTPGLVASIATKVTEGALILTAGVHDLHNMPGAPEGTFLRLRIDPWRGNPADFGMANRYHGNDHYPKMHVVLADDDNRLPGDPDCQVARYQMLGLPEKGTS